MSEPWGDDTEPNFEVRKYDPETGEWNSNPIPQDPIGLYDQIRSGSIDMLQKIALTLDSQDGSDWDKLMGLNAFLSEAPDSVLSNLLAVALMELVENGVLGREKDCADDDLINWLESKMTHAVEPDRTIAGEVALTTRRCLHCDKALPKGKRCPCQ